MDFISLFGGAFFICILIFDIRLCKCTLKTTPLQKKVCSYLNNSSRNQENINQMERMIAIGVLGLVYYYTKSELKEKWNYYSNLRELMGSYKVRESWMVPGELQTD